MVNNLKPGVIDNYVSVFGNYWENKIQTNKKKILDFKLRRALKIICVYKKYKMAGNPEAPLLFVSSGSF